MTVVVSRWCWHGAGVRGNLPGWKDSEPQMMMMMMMMMDDGLWMMDDG